MKHPLRQVLLLAAVFAALYVGARSLPVPQCALAHYGDSLNEQGEIEYCGEEETFFFDLEKPVYPVLTQLEALGNVAPHSPAHFSIKMQTTSGRPISSQDIIVSHTRPMHLMVVDESLGDYHHIHPEPTGIPGKWTFSFTPQHTGQYHLYFDFVTLHGAKRTLLAQSITVGEPNPASFTAKAPEHALQASSAGQPFALEVTPDPSRDDGTVLLRLKGSGETQSLELQKVMGAFAHLVAFIPERKGLAHLHPLTPLVPGQDTHTPDISFSFNPGESGTFRLWAQVKFDDQEHFLPFDVTLPL